MLLAWRQQIVDVQPILIALGCPILSGLVERALAHGASSITSGLVVSNSLDLVDAAVFFDRGGADGPPRPIGEDESLGLCRRGDDCVQLMMSCSFECAGCSVGGEMLLRRLKLMFRELTVGVLTCPCSGYTDILIESGNASSIFPGIGLLLT